jgi:hypothetical protein
MAGLHADETADAAFLASSEHNMAAIPANFISSLDKV